VTKGRDRTANYGSSIATAKNLRGKKEKKDTGESIRRKEALQFITNPIQSENPNGGEGKLIVV
jgi:hypothetical protein